MCKPYKYNFIYITINKVNGKYYKGKHSTDSIEDGYLGSGKVLQRAILKYGKQNFERHIVAMYDTPEEALIAESLYITDEDVTSKMCYNLSYGGNGINGKPIKPYNNKEKQVRAVFLEVQAKLLRYVA